MAIGDILLRAARRDENATALVWQGEFRSWGELNRSTNRVAAALSSRGVGHGDPVIVAMENRPEFIELYFALAKIGAILVPVPETSSAREIAHFLADSGAKLVAVSKASLAQVREATGENAAVIVNVDGSDGHWANGTPDSEPHCRVDADDVCLIKYSSGTTGTPKGCTISHRSWETAAASLANHVGYGPRDRAALNSPLTMGLGIWLLTTFVAARTTIHLFRTFDPDELCRAIERERITAVCAILALFTRLLEHLEGNPTDLSSLRIFLGAPGPTADAVDSLRRLTALPSFNADIFNGWGSSEAVGFVSFLEPEDVREALRNPAIENRLASVGREAMGARIEIFDDNGATVGVNHVGEMGVRTAFPFLGYWGKLPSDGPVSADGWLMTSDLAYRDETGFIHLAGRKTDMIKSGGLNVYPAEVENVLAAHSAIKVAAVFGVPDDRWGEKVVACVVSVEPLRVETLREHARASLAPYKIPKEIFMLDDLPCNEAGKVLKRELRAMYLAGNLDPADQS